MKSLAKDCRNNNALQMLFRYLEISGYVSAMHALDEMMENYPRVTKRYLFHPKTPLPSGTVAVVTLAHPRASPRRKSPA